MRLRVVLYQVLVNKQPGIRKRYHNIHDGTTGAMKMISWLYLLWMNFAYYFLFCRFLGKEPEMEVYEQKKLLTKESESINFRKEHPSLTVSEYVERLSKYDVISFDIFDTLIFRPFSLPTDLFRIVGEQMQIMDFTNIRIWAEWDARIKCKEKYGHMEVTIADIYRNFQEDVGVPYKKGMQLEIEAELELCYANPFMFEVWKQLQEKGKRIIVVSDMYLPSKILTQILVKNGFCGFERLYVSCEYGKNKASGSLYKKVLSDLMKSSQKKRWFQKSSLPVRVIHVGDNQHSDRDMAVKNGIDSLLYPRIDQNALLYRSFDLSFLIGSAYRGIVTNHLYNGIQCYSMEYEYGFIYGGLFVTGYCHFIHEYCKKHGIQKLLFLSRDGDSLKKAYHILYPEERKNTEYVYWSRKAATILMANEDKHDFFRRFIYHKLNQEYTIAEVLQSMGLEKLIVELSDWKKIWLRRKKREEAEAKLLALKQLEQRKNLRKGSFRWKRIHAKIIRKFSSKQLNKLRKREFVNLRPRDELTDKNGYLLRRFIEAKWDKVLAIYETQQIAAKRYYQHVLQGVSKAAAIDIGWAGSGAMALRHLTAEVWDIPCEVIGLVAGTNTMHNLEPDASEPFLQSGKLAAYLFSQQHNRDLLKKHDLDKDYNVFWELLLSSPTPQFTGFADGWNQMKNKKNQYIKELDLTLCFGKYDANQKGIREIQRGILDFVKQYQLHFSNYPYMFRISGRDAYAPMLVAASHHEKYLNVMEKKFNLEVNVN